MKSKTLFLTSLCLAALAMFVSCKKKKEEVTPKPPHCRLQETRRQDGSLEYLANYKDGKLTRSDLSYMYSPFSVVYDEDSVFIRQTFSSQPWRTYTIKIKLGPNGMAQLRTGIDVNQTYYEYDTVRYEYDADGYLIKKETRTSTASKDDPTTVYPNEPVTQTYVIKNGNTIQSYYNGTLQDSFTYYTDRENVSGLDIEGMYSFVRPLFGRVSKNMLKSHRDRSDNESEYSYKYNEYGYVTSIIGTGIYGGLATHYDISWECE